MSVCEYCDQSGASVSAMCAHEHLVEIQVCLQHVGYFTSGIGCDDGNIHCPTCAWGVAKDYKHWCFLTLLPDEKKRHAERLASALAQPDSTPGVSS